MFQNQSEVSSLPNCYCSGCCRCRRDQHHNDCRHIGAVPGLRRFVSTVSCAAVLSIRAITVSGIAVTGISGISTVSIVTASGISAVGSIVSIIAAGIAIIFSVIAVSGIVSVTGTIGQLQSINCALKLRRSRVNCRPKTRSNSANIHRCIVLPPFALAAARCGSGRRIFAFLRGETYPHAHSAFSRF